MYWSKIRTMSARELLSRAQQQSYQYIERLQHQRSAPTMTDAALWAQLDVPRSQRSAQALWTSYQSRQTPRFFLDRERPEALRQLILAQFPDILPQAREAAANVMQHQLAFLGLDVTYGEQIQWQADPLSRVEWPTAFYADISLSDGDVKYVWELNRHQYLVDLGKAYWLTGKVMYADTFRQLLSDWIERNPYNTGVNWANALEPAYRVFSWIWTYAMCHEAMTPDFHLMLLKSMYQHGRYINTHLEMYRSPYNHLIGEAAALYFIGTLFPEFKSSKRWAERGWRILDAQLERQFHVDGFTVEQASFYHYATLGFYVLATLLRRLNGQPVRQAVWDRLEQAIEWSVFVTQPNGRVPQLGDCDDARPIWLGAQPLWDFREFHAIGAVFFQRPDFKVGLDYYAEDALWLLGTEGYTQFNALACAEPVETSKAFPHSGYYLMRSDWTPQANWGSFDCGPQSAGLYPHTTPSAAHGHADALSVLLTIGGEPALVDAGSYCYNSAPEWRDYFRQTRAHNTVVIDGHNQSHHHGGMTWSHSARAHCETWVSTPTYDYVCGHHDGYERLPSPVQHRRAVFFRKPSYWLLFDAVNGAGEHLVESYMHFAPCQLDQKPGGFNAELASGRTLCIRLAGSSLALEQMTTSQLDQPESGWIGTSYGCRLAAPVVRWHAQLTLPQRWGVLLAWGEGEWDLDLDEDTGVFRVRGPECDDRYVWQADIEPGVLPELGLPGPVVHLDGCAFVWCPLVPVGAAGSSGSRLIEDGLS